MHICDLRILCHFSDAGLIPNDPLVGHSGGQTCNLGGRLDWLPLAPKMMCASERWKSIGISLWISNFGVGLWGALSLAPFQMTPWLDILTSRGAAYTEVYTVSLWRARWSVPARGGKP